MKVKSKKVRVVDSDGDLENSEKIIVSDNIETQSKGKKRKSSEAVADVQESVEATGKHKNKKRRKSLVNSSATTILQKGTNENGSSTDYVPGALSSLFGTAKLNKDDKEKKDLFSKHGEGSSVFVDVQTVVDETHTDKKEKQKEEKRKAGIELRDRTQQRINRKKLPPNERMSEEEKKRTVFVGNAPPTMTRKQVEKLFSSCGKIESVRARGTVGSKRNLTKKAAYLEGKINTNLKSIIFYVKFAEAESIKAAIEKNGFEVDGHHLRVDSCTGRKAYESKMTVFVGNLPFDAAEDELLGWAEKIIGETAFVRIVRDPETGYGKGFGFIAFKDMNAVNVALNMKEAKFQKNILRITKIKKKNALKKMQQQSKGGRRMDGSRDLRGSRREKRPSNGRGEGGGGKPHLSKKIVKEMKKRKAKQFHSNMQ